MRLTLRLSSACLLVLLGGCSNLGYYWQSISGQMDIWRRERPIEEVMSDPRAPEALRRKLAAVARIREFASRELGLPDNRSYRRYADLGRPYVVWNVFAAPEFSVQPREWCFPFAGCVSYRGYFSDEEAERFAGGLAKQGYDVYVGGVPAYSTLGWFDDPVLNTIIDHSEAQIARLIFHELSHQLVYVRDDTVFNESFAVAVEEEGVRRWLTRAGDARSREEFERGQRIRADFARLIQNYRQRLDALYRTRLAPEAMRERKHAMLAEFEAEYRGMKAGWGGFTGYDRWFALPPNNAQIASVAVYTQLVPAFEALLKREGGDLARFYRAVKGLAGRSKEVRDRELGVLAGRVNRAHEAVNVKGRQ